MLNFGFIKLCNIFLLLKRITLQHVRFCIVFVLFFDIRIILAYQTVARKRSRLRITSYVSMARKKGLLTNLSILKAYLGGGGGSKLKLLDSGRKMALLLDAWLSASEGLRD